MNTGKGKLTVFENVPLADHLFMFRRDPFGCGSFIPPLTGADAFGSDARDVLEEEAIAKFDPIVKSEFPENQCQSSYSNVLS